MKLSYTRLRGYVPYLDLLRKNRIAMTLIFLLIMPLTVAASCSNSNVNNSPSGADIFFPVQMDKYAQSPHPLALARGTLVLDGKFLRIKPLPDLPASNNLMIWPPGFSFYIEEGGIHIIDRDGTKVASTGDVIEAGGGQVPVEIVEKYIGRSLPIGSHGPYWLAFKVVKIS